MWVDANEEPVSFGTELGLDYFNSPVQTHYFFSLGVNEGIVI